ncbi:MAG TPA: PIN domain-containing protein [Ferruginibacter sp.]|nr:PIN domain-containing protein [Ferruginibacter sp.]
MIHSSRFLAVLDANVLYPAPLRDYLLSLAELGLYKPKWSNEIQDEWIRKVLVNRPDLKKQQLEKTHIAMDSAFPDATITHYESLIEGLSLPDKKDRHVLAAAIREKADVIVTINLKDFPPAYLKTFDIEVQHPDEFITNLIHLDKIKSLEALNNQARRLQNPPKMMDEVLAMLKKCGLKHSVSLLRTL